MKIVIDIPEYDYERIKEYYNSIPDGGEVDANIVYIAESTPLPKGHGRLIDADFVKNTLDLFVLNEYGGSQFIRRNDIDKVPTIIEADKETDNG